MKVLACNLNMFEMKHGIYVFDDETGSSNYIGFSDIEHLPEIITSFCYDKKIYEIHLFGGKAFANKIAEDIITINKLKYSNDKEIIVEVN